MKHVNCQICGNSCVKYGKTKAGSQRWFCNNCKTAFTIEIDNSAKQLQIFLKWLFSKQTQHEMPGEGRTFRRKSAQFWNIWPLPPVVNERKNVLYLDGIYISRKACILICCDEQYVLGWYLCRYENAGAWTSLLSRIAAPKVAVSDGGTGFAKALKKMWPHTEHQRCVYHVFSQVKRYTTGRPKTPAGTELFMLSKDLLQVDSREKSEQWIERFINWMKKYMAFLSQITRDENGNERPTHERLLKAQRAILRLIGEETMFTYLDEDLLNEIEKIPSTNNRIEGGINSRLRAMLRDHRGLSIERRIKAVFWWCYMHSPKPLSASEILKIMPTDKSISEIYKKMNHSDKLENSIPTWGDAVVWGDLHSQNSTYRSDWC